MYESDVENAALAWYEDQGWRSCLVKGVEIEYLRPDGTNGYDSVLVIDYDEPDNNDWLVVNQFKVTEARGACGPRCQ